MSLIHWHTQTLDHLTALLLADADVRGLLLGGSCARGDGSVDFWSDIDLVVTLADGALARFHPGVVWLSAIGELFAVDTNATPDYAVTRAQFTDGRRIDFVLVEESSLARKAEWTSNPLRDGGTVLFSRSPVLPAITAQVLPVPPLESFSPDAFRALCNQFRFKAMLAVTKAARDELLVALHLSLDMIRDALLLGMLLRDRATGTNHHRDGSQGNHHVAALAAASQPFTRAGILESIAQTALAFDALGTQWTRDYQPCTGVLRDLVAKARE